MRTCATMDITSKGKEKRVVSKQLSAYLISKQLNFWLNELQTFLMISEHCEKL